MRPIETLDETVSRRDGREEKVPGILVVHSCGAPMMRGIPLVNGKLVLGREQGDPLFLRDERLSRQHAEISFDGTRWTVRDLQSRNGTFVDGVKVEGAVSLDRPRVVRIGRTLLLASTDLRRLIGDPVSSDGIVAGPSFRDALAKVSRAAGVGQSVLITGESGTGKEVAARAFHASCPYPSGPMVPVNCAAIPHGVAERLLFGAKRGAYSGATSDVGGYVQAAERGVLFLDEVGELELEVQAKILRLLEAREVLPLGAATARKVELAICFATNRDLRAAAADGRFREDLFYRIAEPEVHLPPLRDRPEEIPWLLGREIAKVDSKITPDARFVEACLLRVWPGNVRELLGAARRAAQDAKAAGAQVIAPEHLGPTAGIRVGDVERESKREPSEPPPARAEVTREAIVSALQSNDGNVAAAARALGLHRTQLYRMMKKLGVEG